MTATAAADLHRPKSNVTSYVYDGFGDRIQQASPDSGTTVFYFDPDSTSPKSPSPSPTTPTTRSTVCRRATYPADSSLNVALIYDSPGHGYGVGHLTGVTDAAGSLARLGPARPADHATPAPSPATTTPAATPMKAPGGLRQHHLRQLRLADRYGRDAAGPDHDTSPTPRPATARPISPPPRPTCPSARSNPSPTATA